MGECSDSRRYSFQKLNTNTTETHSRCVEAAQGDGVVKCIGAFRRNYVTDNGASCGSLNMSILFVGLLEVILTKVESNIALRDALMKLILEKLTEAKIFPNLSGIVTELEPLRKHYLSGFWKIIQEARKSVSSIVPLSGVQSSAIDLQTLSLPYPKNWFHDFLNASRYDDNFEELELLGQGGFGVVYKARNRVDLALYAVKKIFLKDFSHDNKLKILREARVIAGLKHSNIVCYHTAWLEYVPNIPDVFKCSSQTKSDSSTQSRIDLRGSNITSDFSSPYQQQEDSESEGGIIFEPLETEEVKRSSFEKNGLNLNEKGDIEKSESVSVEQDKSETSNASRKRSTPSFSRSFSCPHAVDSEIVQRTPKHCVDIASLRAPSYQNVSGCFALFIQMQLYQSSLKEWVTKRNQLAKGSWSCVEHNSNVQILKQILSGLKYIHAKNIVHRDLKLQNIFIDPKNCHVWIGDFGLARVIENIGANESQSDESLVRTPLIQEPVIGLSDGIGSYPYVAPELLNGSKAYSSKVDMFSLGIVLYELYRPFDTYMERAKTIETLKRTGNVPDETLLQNWPLVCSWINKLVSVDPNNRPTSTQLFDSVCREEPGQKISIGLNTSNSTSQETATLLQQMHTRLKSLEEENLKMKRIVQRTKVRERNRRRQNFKLRLQLLKFKQS